MGFWAGNPGELQVCLDVETVSGHFLGLCSVQEAPAGSDESSGNCMATWLLYSALTSEEWECLHSQETDNIPCSFYNHTINYS